MWKVQCQHSKIEPSGVHFPSSFSTNDATSDGRRAKAGGALGLLKIQDFRFSPLVWKLLGKLTYYEIMALAHVKDDNVFLCCEVRWVDPKIIQCLCRFVMQFSIKRLE